MVRIRWLRTSRIVALCSLANFINSADRVIMPIAIVPMTDIFNWSLHTQGSILSAFAFGYFSSQILGEIQSGFLYIVSNDVTFQVVCGPQNWGPKMCWYAVYFYGVLLHSLLHFWLEALQLLWYVGLYWVLQKV